MVRSTTNPLRLLIVDDDPMICRSLKAVAERCGFVAKCFSNVRHAYREVPQDQFDLAVVDYDLGRVSGTQFSRYLEKYGKLTPVLLISNSGPIDASKWTAQVVGSVGKLGGPTKIIGRAIDLLKA